MTTIESQPLSAEVRLVNDAPNGAVKPGDSLQYEVRYQNNTKVAATGVNVVVELDSKAIDPATIKVESGYIEGSTVTWNGSSVPELEKLNPNESGVVRFSAQVRNPAAKDGSKNIVIVARAKMKSNENSTFLPGNEVTVKVSSPSSMERSVSSVSGPVPPVVGQTTTLQVSMALRNATNDYREGVLIGYVPLGVTFDKSSVTAAEAAAVRFDSRNR